MKIVSLRTVVAAAIGLVIVCPIVRAQDASNSDVRQDRRELRGDRREIRQDRRELRGDREERREDRREIRSDRQQLHAGGMRAR